ncbi:MAG: hypothetical protein JRG91_15245 [Deltaproteobacteria bacterium]|nr:hypothetical protein [Deltaproteobacteria bacterium]
MHRHIIAAWLAFVLAACGGAVKSGSDARQDTIEDTAVDTHIDQPVDAPEDSAEEPTPDITVDIAPDAEEDTATDPTPECGTHGALMWGICWYLGSPGQDCYEVCGPHGGYHEDTPEYVGTPSQGGSIEECGAILDALGYSGTVSDGYRDDGRGLGCHRWNDGALWWLHTPDFDPGDSMDPSQAVCGCNE